MGMSRQKLSFLPDFTMTYTDVPECAEPESML